ncbi:uncharacterized protein LOC132722208 [Ruditapes philippinarum]|uniref:uncharacterized protein LOC132722208 n=1 Tax=Ruditapes philippinarum TaxID=129788 RepID=UPI00295BD32D|nr:uncharacterized protein LOC132722208 [Ruditapes philippinarum]
MSTTTDKDEYILTQARSMLPYVRVNGHPHFQVQSLLDVPWLLVLVFELLTTQPMSDDMGRFDTLERQAHVLQMILDTLEQTLRLPLTHISGIGLARLERRHLADALQIFSDLVKHCYLTPTKETAERGELESPEGRKLSLSQFESPKFHEVDFSKFSTPELITVLSASGGKEKDRDIGTTRKNESKPSSIVTVRPVPQNQARSYPSAREHPSDVHLPERDENNTNFLGDNSLSRQAEKEDSFRSSKSSTTLAKEVYRREENIDRLLHDRRRGPRQGVDLVDKHENYKLAQKHQIFAPCLPSLSLLSPSKKEQRKKFVSSLNKGVVDDNKRDHMTSSERAGLSRFSPYELPCKHNDLIEYPLTKRVPDHSRDKLTSAAKSANIKKKADDKNIKPAMSFQRLCRKPSVKSFRSPKLSTSRRYPQKDARQLSSATSGPTTCQNKDNMSELRNRTKSELKTSVRNTKQTDDIPKCPRKPHSATFKPQPSCTGNIKKPPTYHARRPSISVKFVSKGERPIQRTRNGSVQSRRQADELYVTSPFTDREEPDAYSPIKYHNTEGNSRRRPSVVSTKARKHSLASPQSPYYKHDRSSRFSRPIKRGDVSPQTTSLCTSLKLLEDFDYVKRRLKQITIQKREYREAICELEREEVRLEYLLTHVQQQTTRALNKGPSQRVSSQGRLV